DVAGKIELTHPDKQPYGADGKAEWPFRFIAPLTPGPATLFIAAQSVNGNGNNNRDHDAALVQNLTVVAAHQAPTVMTPPALTPPGAVAGTQVTLTVLGADDEGEANLTYTWSTTGTPPAPVTFTPAARNGSNAAKSITATFSKAGTYAFSVRLKDGPGL